MRLYLVHIPAKVRTQFVSVAGIADPRISVSSCEMMSPVQWATLGLLSFLGILTYIHDNDRKLKAIPARAAQFSPNRWSPKDVERMASGCELATPSIDDQLPPKTGRRYIVVGGVRRPFLSLKCTDEALGRIPGWMDRPAAAQTRRRPEAYQDTRHSTSQTPGSPRRKGKGCEIHTSRYW